MVGRGRPSHMGGLHAAERLPRAVWLLTAAIVDHNRPPAPGGDADGIMAVRELSYDALMKCMWTDLQECLPAWSRVTLLGEPPEQAATKAQACWTKLDEYRTAERAPPEGHHE